ncbi:hypothetical protein J6590_041113, partial [Homalodisca vitripennis]
ETHLLMSPAISADCGSYFMYSRKAFLEIEQITSHLNYSFERAHLVELNAANRISKGLSNQKWRLVLGTHCEVHYALPFLTGSSYSDAVGGVSLY